VKSLYFGIAVISLILTGCGGGGSSVPDESTTGTTPTDETNTTDLVAGVDYTDPSQFLQTTVAPAHLLQVNAQEAYNNGFTGGNLSATMEYTTVESDTSNRDLQTIIAVLDSGVNADHEEMNATGKIAVWKDFSSTNSATPYDVGGHGSFVSGIVAAERQDAEDPYFGMAYGAQLAVGQIFYQTADGYMTDNVLLTEALNWVAEQKTVLDVPDIQRLVAVNLSLGTTDAASATAELKGAMKAVLNSGVTMAIAAGNDGLDCSSATSGKCAFPAAIPWINTAETADYLNAAGGYIVVGSVDENNVISDFSNRAGVMKSNYLVAPGENITSISNTVNDGYVTGSGTSFATPIVAGAMALMAQKWPYLNGRTHAQILFDTATDLGAVGVDNVYGNGLLNLTDAFNPVGTLVLPLSVSNVNIDTTSGQNTTSLIGTSMRISPAMASLASFEPLNATIGIDNYHRDFQVNMTGSIINDGYSPVDFDDFITFRRGDFLLGVDPIRRLPLMGYALGDGMKVSVAFDGETMLGMKGDGAFATKGGQTAYIDAKKVFRLGQGMLVGIEGTYAYGRAAADPHSLIQDVSAVHALGGKATVGYNGFGIGYEIPLRVVDGSMSFNLPTDIDSEGNVIYTQSRADLSPDTFEQTYSLFYRYGISNIRFLSELSRTTDAYGINGVISDKAKVIFNIWY